MPQHGVEQTIKAASTLLRARLKAYHHQHQLKSLDELAARIGVSVDAIYNWRRGGLPKLDILAKIRRPLEFTDDEVKLLERGLVLKRKLSSRGRKMAEGQDDTPVQPEGPAADLRTELAALKESVAQFERRLQSRGADDHWTENGMAFVLTPRNWVPVNGSSWKPSHTQETKELIQELRRRLILIAQMTQEGVRDKLKEPEQLGQELNELWQAFTIVDSVVPLQCARTIEDQGLRFRMG